MTDSAPSLSGVIPTEQLLRDAADLATSDPYGAIELLTCANRVARHSRIEALLVALRADAFARIVWPTERPPLPSPGSRRFTEPGIPEIQPDALDAELVRDAIAKRGSLIVRGLFGRQIVRNLVARIDDAFAGFDRKTESGLVADGAPGFVPFPRWPAAESMVVERIFLRSGGGVLLVDSPAAFFDLVETFDAVGLSEVIAGVFGEDPVMLARKCTLRRVPASRGPGDWHQDGAFMGENIRSLNVWVALSDCGEDAPGLDIVARRLETIVDTGTEGARLNWTVSPDMVDEVAPDSVERPVFRAGDVLLFDQMNLHRTAVTPGMRHDRYAIETWFLAPSTYPAMVSRFTETPGTQIPIVYSRGEASSSEVGHL